jgi:hypothetical protein
MEIERRWLSSWQGAKKTDKPWGCWNNNANNVQAGLVLAKVRNQKKEEGRRREAKEWHHGDYQERQRGSST